MCVGSIPTGGTSFSGKLELALMTLLLLAIFVIASVLLLSAVVLVDRLNFPQKKFQAQSLPQGDEALQDHTGAHMVDPEEDFAN